MAFRTEKLAFAVVIVFLATLATFTHASRLLKQDSNPLSSADPDQQFGGSRNWDQAFVEAALAALKKPSFGDGNFPFIAKDDLQSAVSVSSENAQSALDRSGANLNVVSQRIADP
eukprot:jgi/Botrbrau1/2214/Bobra.101_2s0043.1